MTREEAIEYVASNIYGGSKEQLEEDIKRGYVAVVYLRNKAVLLPKEGCDGSLRDESDWAYLDMVAKIDRGFYGAVYYFKNMKRACIWVKEDE